MKFEVKRARHYGGAYALGWVVWHGIYPRWFLTWGEAQSYALRLSRAATPDEVMSA